MSCDMVSPENIGIIMDGNGRWAEQRGLPRTAGHTQGMKNLISIASHAFDCGAKTVTCYSLSSENLKRPAEEVQHILSLIPAYSEPFVQAFCEKEIAAKFVGNLELLPQPIRESLASTQEALSKFDGNGKTLYLAIAYGSRAEIVQAVNAAVKAGTCVTEASLLGALSVPFDLDLIIRTGKEQRLSNFFLYQSSYAELYFPDQYFPDFGHDDLEQAFSWYQSRKRRYGLT